MTDYVCYVDGGCHGNGRQDAATYGSYMIFEVPDVTRPPSHAEMTLENPVYESRRFPLGMNTTRRTNNTAEAQAMLMLVTELFNRGVLDDGNRIIIYSDSQTVLNHLLGTWNVSLASNHLMAIYKSIYGVFDRYERRQSNTRKVLPDLLELRWIKGIDMKVVLGH